MKHNSMEILTRQYYAYVHSFCDDAGVLPLLMQLKLEHTLHVVEDVRHIMVGESWPEEMFVIGEMCALLHDAGRYSQLQEFGTFEDSKSINHAHRGVEVIMQEGWLKELPADVVKQMLTVVELHNTCELSPTLDTAVATFAHLVRDADKLDIFRVLERAILDGSLEHHPEIAWGLDIKGPPSSDVVAAVSNGQLVNYANVRTLADFILIQVGWIAAGLHYLTALRMASARRVLAFREAYLKTLSDDSRIDQCCRVAEACVNARLNG